MTKKILSSILFITLVSCTSVSKETILFSTPKTPTIHYVYLGEMLQKCYQYTPLWIKLFGGIPFACTEWTETTCDIYISKDAPEWMLKHELEHCNGFGH